MIALASQFARRTQILPMDTGCVFPWGSGGRDVRVRLLTSDPDKARACGDKLRQWGLPYMPEVLAMPRSQATFAFDLLAKGDPMASLPLHDPRHQMFAGHATVPRFIRFGGDVLMLETTEKPDVMAFSQWFDKAAKREVAFKKPKPPTLSQLADAGEIQTIYPD